MSFVRNSLTGKISIVTGASRGIGCAIARQLARAGSSVLLTARDEAKLAEVAAAIQSEGGTAIVHAADLREPGAAEAIAANASSAFGGIDIVINNAGATKRGDFRVLTDADWADGFALKFFGAVRLIRAAWPHLKARKGSVLNISGIGGKKPGAEFTIGGSVNAALLSLTKALADAGVGDGIQVNAINPGRIRTDRFAGRLAQFAQQQGIPLAEAEAQMIRDVGISRIGEPQDIAGLVQFIVSPQGRFLQGALIDMDGGETKSI